ncbi:hypothetical protein [Mycobacteroides abscessus]|uniref:hypothetical protein n=2 Tax=Mycobacteroides abscessus TaxID=36809 RepID=UPI0027DB45DD|nr:hypothetical protein [Mycobacteroides abscessus]
MLPTSTGLFDIEDLMPGAVVPTVCLSYGMGLDSTCLLLRWLEEPASRDFDLSELVVVTAHTGDEFDSTRAAVERHVLPRLREHGVRFVQTARSQRLTSMAGAGVVVLDDSTAPEQLHFRGRYRLSDEMLSQGTIPQRGGYRSCSIHAKGNCLDPVIAKLTRGRPYRHAVGFEVNEQGRALKDSKYNSELRTGWYPLVEWGFTREHCQEYVSGLTGERWSKSACGYCPFALSSATGRSNVVERYRSEPAVGAQALLLESIAQALNPRQTLIEGSSVAELIRFAGLGAVRAAYEDLLSAMTFAVYDVRRVTTPSREGRRGMTARSVRALRRGTRAEMDTFLATLPGTRSNSSDGITRHTLPAAPRCEHLLVVAPAVVQDKQRPQFETLWQQATSEALL